MRKLILGLVATAAIASPLALATSANAADSTGTIDTTTYSDGTYHHVLPADYTCGTGVDGKTNITFTLAGGSGTLVPDTNGGGTFAFSGATGNYGWSYGGTYNAAGAWTDADASAGFDGVLSEVYGFGTEGRATGDFGTVVGSFIGIPTCTTPEVPATVTGNHGEYVSGATKAGIKGKALAAVAKDVTLVGPYKG